MSAPKAKRPDLRGRGYVPKGGVAAARAHNERERAAAAEAAAVADVRTDARASASAGRADDTAASRSPWTLTPSWAVRAYVAGGAAVGALTYGAGEHLFGGR